MNESASIPIASFGITPLEVISMPVSSRATRSGRASTSLAIALLCTGVMLISGCGQSEYEARMSQISTTLAKRGGGDLLLKDYFSVTDAASVSKGIKFKLPTLFSGAKVKSLGADVPTAKISQVDIPGFCYTLQTTLADDAEKQFPAYCYLYAMPKATTQLEPLKATIKQALVAIDPTFDWNVGTVDGDPKRLPLHYKSAKGTFDFEVNGAVEKQPGTLAVFLVEGAENYVLIGWRYEQKSAVKNNLLEAVANSMVTMVPDGPTPDGGAAAPAANPMPMPGQEPPP